MNIIKKLVKKGKGRYVCPHCKTEFIEDLEMRKPTKEQLLWWKNYLKENSKRK